MTSLNAPGFSFSLLNVSAVSRQLLQSSTPFLPASSPIPFSPSDIIVFIDSPTDATAWSGVRSYWDTRKSRAEEVEEVEKLVKTFTSLERNTDSGSTVQAKSASFDWKSIGLEPDIVESGIRGACNAVLSVEAELTRFDTLVGDGDCGETFSSGATGLYR